MERLTERWDPHRPRASAMAALAVMITLAGTARATESPDSTRFATRLPPAQVRRWQTGALRADRLQHASLAFTLAAGIGGATRDPRSAFGTTLALGLLKECWDARRSRFDPVDLGASAVGASFGSAAAAAIDR